MADKSNIKQELLKQMDTRPAGDRTGIELMEKIISRDMARIRRLKWITGICWLLVLVCLAVPGVIELVKCIPGGILGFTPQMIDLLVPDYYVSALAIVTRGLLVIAVILTISLYVRSRTLTMHQLQARLAGIEEQLKKMAQDESATHA